MADMWMRSTTFIFFILALAVLGVAHTLSTAFFLYWTYPWLDMPMHALGGAVVALGFLSVQSRYARGKFQKGFFVALSVAFAVGILWELFELTSGTTGTKPDYLRDTIVDLSMDIIGGAIGFLLGRASVRFDRSKS